MKGEKGSQPDKQDEARLLCSRTACREKGNVDGAPNRHMLLALRENKNKASSVTLLLLSVCTWKKFFFTCMEEGCSGGATHIKHNASCVCFLHPMTCLNYRREVQTKNTSIPAYQMHNAAVHGVRSARKMNSRVQIYFKNDSPATCSCFFSTAQLRESPLVVARYRAWQHLPHLASW